MGETSGESLWGTDQFDANQLSAEDLAVLQAFHDLENFEVEASVSEALPQAMTQQAGAEQAMGGRAMAGASPATTCRSEDAENNGQAGVLREDSSGAVGGRFIVHRLSDSLLTVFATEAEEDIGILWQTLEQLKEDECQNFAALGTLHRTAHKLKGTAGAIGYNGMSTLARYIQRLIEQMKSGAVAYTIGVLALEHAVRALEMTLQSIILDGQENNTLLAKLEADFQALRINVHATAGTATSKASPEEECLVHLASKDKVDTDTAPIQSANDTTCLPLRGQADCKEKEEISRVSPHYMPIDLASTSDGGVVSRSMPFVRVDGHHLEQLVLHTEQMLEQLTPLESAQRQVETALSELQAAHTRLQHVEMMFTTAPPSLKTTDGGRVLDDDHSPSSLIAGILNEAVSRTGHIHHLKSKLYPYLAQLREDALWDELEIERYTESSILANFLREAIADVATASSQLRIAFTKLNSIVKQHVAQASTVRSDALLLRSAPLSTVVMRLERAIQMMAKAQKAQIHFEVKGEATEIDQDILEGLTNPLLQLLRNCIAEGLMSSKKLGNEERKRTNSIWLYTQASGNEVTIEIGFSMIVNGGGLDAIQKAISDLNGSITASRNDSGGIRFLLRFPRSRGVVQGLLVRVSNQSVVVPFSQVQRIDAKYAERSTLYDLNMLLGFPSEPASLEKMRPVLIVQSPISYLMVQVDEILGDVELVMKPLAAHLQRPGIAGTAIDGTGNVLLIVDLPELLRRKDVRAHQSPRLMSPPGVKAVESESKKTGQSLEQASPRVLVADNSVGANNGEGKPRHYTSNARVLVADDSVYIRQSLRQVLNRAGYTVLEARDGIEALEQLLESPPDLLLLDIEMPNLNGYDLLSIFRTFPPDQELARMKIVMLTSRSSEKHQQRALELGAHDYLTKPCPQDMLLKTIRSRLSEEK